MLTLRTSGFLDGNGLRRVGGVLPKCSIKIVTFVDVMSCMKCAACDVHNQYMITVVAWAPLNDCKAGIHEESALYATLALK